VAGSPLAAEREAARNRRLRAVDWRFLLPDPRPDRTVCLATGGLADALSLFTTIVQPALAGGGDVDLGVAVNPSRRRLRQLWDALRPGGACYTEWWLPLAGGAHAVRRRLEAAGFQDVACYWPGPWPARIPPPFWIPAEAAGALTSFLTSQPSGRALRLRPTARLGRAVWLAAIRRGVALPVCAIARKPPVGPSPGPSDPLLTDWDSGLLGPPPERLSRLLLTGGPRSISKVVALVFAEPDARPRLAIKFARVPESIAPLEREAATLRGVQMPGVPRVVFERRHGPDLQVAETALPGQQLFTFLEAGSARHLALQATDWSIGLARRTAAPPRPDWRQRLVDAALADFAASFGAVVSAAEVRRTAEALDGLPALPSVCEQRDFSPWNVLIDAEGQLVVLDWESSEPHGLPGLDLVYFLTYLCFFLADAIRSGRYELPYAASLEPRTPTGRLVAECQARYADALGLDPAVWRPLRLLTWLIHTRSEYRHAWADAAGPPPPAALRRGLFLSLWRAELRRLT
jgi:hypothetical protein